MKKKYTVNVHCDAVLTVEVVAASEDEALGLAEQAAEGLSLEDADVVGVQSCVTNVEEIQ